MQKIDKQQIKQFTLVSEIEKCLHSGKMSRDTGYACYHISRGCYISLVSSVDENYKVAKTSSNVDWYSDSVMVLFYAGKFQIYKMEMLSCCEFVNSITWILPESIRQAFSKI